MHRVQVDAHESAIRTQVRVEQIRTLYGQSTPVLLANVLNAVILTAVLWRHTPQTWLIGWTLAMTSMAVIRIAMRKRYWSREHSPDEHDVWGRRFTIGSLTAGLLWGFAGGVLMPASLPHQVVVVFVVGGMAAGAAASISAFMPAYFAYLIPSLVPPVVRLLTYGGDERIAMVAMLVLFMGALTLVARNVHRALTQAFRLRFENAGLYAQVSKANAAVVEANERLTRANEELELRVHERTRELRASERQLAEIVNESPDAIVVLDEAGLILSVNPATERITGRPAELLIGRHFALTDMLDSTYLKRAVESFGTLLRGQETPVEEFRLIRPDGQTVFVEAKLRVVRGIDGKQRVHTVVRDVSERHRLQKLKNAYELRLREAERLESVGMLAGGVAHDFNNVLTMILGNVDSLEGPDGAANSKVLLAEIRHGSLQAANLTKQLLAFSRKQLLDVQPTDVAQVVSSARAVFERVLGEQNRLVIEVPADPMVVLVDSTQLEQAVMNLLVNARHAMPDGGRVVVDVRRIQIESDSEWPEAEPGSYVLLSVTDSGVGMDESTRSRVFEPFFTTKERGYGTGLGLASVHGLIKQAGGYIRVISELGLGSRFEIVLPYHAAAASEASKEGAPAWSPGTGTVLLVEDQPQVRRALERILADAGYQVVSAEDGEQALELARKREGRIDLVVTDVIMPGISGIELSRRLFAGYPHLAVLLISGYAGNEITLLAELGDSVQFLQKPFNAASLTAAAQAAIQRARAAAAREQPANLSN